MASRPCGRRVGERGTRWGARGGLSARRCSAGERGPVWEGSRGAPKPRPAPPGESSSPPQPCGLCEARAPGPSSAARAPRLSLARRPGSGRSSGERVKRARGRLEPPLRSGACLPVPEGPVPLSPPRVRQDAGSGGGVVSPGGRRGQAASCCPRLLFPSPRTLWTWRGVRRGAPAPCSGDPAGLRPPPPPQQPAGGCSWNEPALGTFPHCSVSGHRAPRTREGCPPSTNCRPLGLRTTFAGASCPR